MTPAVIFVLNTIIRERKEAALKGERITAEDIALRWEAHHKVKPLLPPDETLRNWLHAHVVQKARLALGDVRDDNGSRVILSPIPIGPARGPRGYIGREAMAIGEHLNLAAHQIATGSKKRNEGMSRQEVSGEAIALGRSMADPLGELAAKVTAKEGTE